MDIPKILNCLYVMGDAGRKIDAKTEMRKYCQEGVLGFTEHFYK